MRILVILLTLFLMAECYFTVCRNSKTFSILNNFVISSIFSLIVYALASAVLFMVDEYSVFRALLSANIISVLALIFSIVFTAKQSKKGDFFTKKQIFFVVFIVFFVLYLAYPQSGLSRITTDAGRYQLKAMELINGNGDNYIVYHINPNLPEKQKKLYKESVEELMYLWPGERDLDNGRFEEKFHNLPTFSSCLALSGIIFGVDHMQVCQVFFWILLALIVYLTLESLSVNFEVQLACVSIIILSPQIIYQVKSTLCDLFLLLMFMCFVFFLLNNELKKIAWLPVLGFALFHIEIFAVVPLIVVCFWILAIMSRDKMYLTQSNLSICSYLLGYLYAFGYNSDYLVQNYNGILKLFSRNVDETKITFVVVCVSVITIFINLILSKCIKKYSTMDIKCDLIYIVSAFVYLIFGLLCIKKGMSLYRQLTGRTVTNIIYAIYSTGGLMVPLSLIGGYIFILKRKKELSVYILTAILFYGVFAFCFFMPTARYLYYYERYLASFMYVAVIFGGLIINKYSNKIPLYYGTLFIIALFVLSFIKPDIFMKKAYVDTEISWKTYCKVADSMEKNNSAIVVGKDDLEVNKYYFMSFHTLGIDPYVEIESYSIEEQCNNLLKAGYSNVYFYSDYEIQEFETIESCDENYFYTMMELYEYDEKTKFPKRPLEMKRTMYLQKVD